MHYTVKQLANLSGVSVRTLHHYDQIGLLKPLIRTEAGYRLYGKEELLKLQQILFYRELKFPLKEIGAILHREDFDLVQALHNHKAALLAQQGKIDRLIATIDNTIFKLEKNQDMLNPEELYEGLSKEDIANIRKEAYQKYGDQVTHAEKELRKLSKQELNQLKKQQKENLHQLFNLKDHAIDSENVQKAIAIHYTLIRKFWGTHNQEDKQAEQYACLGDLYVSDERFTSINGEAQPEFALFLKKAMRQYADNILKA